MVGLSSGLDSAQHKLPPHRSWKSQEVCNKPKVSEDVNEYSTKKAKSWSIGGDSSIAGTNSQRILSFRRCINDVWFLLVFLDVT